MPLSENEQRQLEAIERALYAEDPKFASSLNSSDLRTHARRKLRRSIAVLVVGALLLVGIVVNVWVPVAGIVLMFIGAVGVVQQLKRLSGRATTPLAVLGPDGSPVARPQRAPRPRPKEGWRDRVEQRWHRRFEDPDL
ncbi:MAG TPA: DUF3040 domain-containing protein [Mycobacteriales bacterium]|nr:DUF3040 domain-containing protein [Mycobacteriales bacterium]